MTQFQQIVTGYSFLEAPRVDSRGIWFSEMVQGGIRCLRRDGDVGEWLTDRSMIGGIAFNDDGLVICSGPGGFVWLNPDNGNSGTLLDRIDDAPINGVNDFNPDGKGGLYFATADLPALSRGEKPGASAMYHLDPTMRVTQLCTGLTFGNGIGISPDGRRLYHAETWAGTCAYDLRPNGSLGRCTRLSELQDCDGLAVDQEGGVWFASFGTGAIIRLLADGTVDRKIEVPGGLVTSLCFGGPDWRDLYVTTGSPGVADDILAGRKSGKTDGSIYHMRSEIPGLPVGSTRFRIRTD